MRHFRFIPVFVLAVLGLCATAAADEPPKQGGVELTSLRLMREKGLLTQEEYDSAIRDVKESTGQKGAEGANTVVVGKWATTLYGFLEADHIYDSTQSLNDAPGNAPIAHSGTLAGNNGRFQMGVRNSRIGLRLKAPEYHRIKTSAMAEMDFLGTQLPVGVTQPYQGSEGAFFTNPTFRVRHFNLKMETPIVDILIGQYWQLLGWQSVYHPNTVEIQGIPGQVYSRTPQVRISKTIKTEAVTFEIAAAMTRPVQRDSATPEGQGGLRLAINNWKGMNTGGSTGSGVMPMSVAVTGYVRQVSIPEFSGAPKVTKDRVASGFAVDGFIPIIPQSNAHKGNSLSFTGEFAYGYGSGDFYTGLNPGIGYPALPAPAGGGAAPVYNPDIDNGIVAFDANGDLHFIQWQSYLLGLQYYFPGVGGKLWVSGNYSHIDSSNTHFYGARGKAFDGIDWWDVNVFADVTPAVRLGVEYASTITHYLGPVFPPNELGGERALNQRVQVSAFYLF